MDLRHYFRKMREVESSLTEEYPLIVSRETSDGGRPGQVSEVSRAVAAQLIVEGKAVLADVEDRAIHVRNQEAAKKASEKAEMARRVQVAIVTDSDLSVRPLSTKN